MIDWKRKLTSRKLWMAIIGFVTGLLVFLGYSEQTATQIGSLIMMGASVLGYIIGEGLSDTATVDNATYVTIDQTTNDALEEIEEEEEV